MKHPRTLRGLSLTAHESDLTAEALRAYAKRLMDTEVVSIEEGRTLDRALRCCPGFSDIDALLGVWSRTAEIRGWDTSAEIQTTKSGRRTYLP